jgi:hypothetical protein
MAGTLNISGLSASEPAGQRALGPMTVQGTVVIGDTQAGPLSSGDNVVTVPTGAVGVVVIPPSTGSATLRYRTSLNNSDAGLPISASAPSVHVFPSPAPTTVILNASGAQAAFTSFWFW